MMYRTSKEGWWMLKTCARDWDHDKRNSDLRAIIRQNCENSTTRSSSFDDILHAMPVSTKNVTYSNVFCAVCNFVQLTIDRLFYWSTSLACNYNLDEKPFTDVNKRQEMSSNVTASNVTENCVVGYFIPPRNVSARQCQLETISTCLTREELSARLVTNVSESNYTCLKSRCQEFVEYEHFNPTYKNRFCALCTGVDTRNFDHAYKGGLYGRKGQPPPDLWHCFGCRSFASILNFSPKGDIMLLGKKTVSVLKTCPVGKVYFKNACISLFCSGDLELVGSECRAPRYLTIQLILYANNTGGELKRAHHNDTVNRVAQSLLAFVRNLTVANSTFHVVNNSVKVFIIAKASASVTVSNWEKIRSKIFQFNLTFVSNFTLFSSEPIKREHITITIKPTLAPIICSAYIRLNSSQYNKTANNSIIDLATGQTLNSTEYIKEENDTILRCNLYKAAFNTTIIVKTWQYDSLGVTLTIVSSAFSIVSCYLLLVTYFLFSKLRNYAGLCIMSYAFALGTFYVFLIFGAGLVNNKATCTAMGFVLHFFTLSHLTWSTVLAVNLVNLFVVKRMQNPTSSGGQLIWKKFFFASLYAWGLPMVICLICTILIYTTDMDISYASTTVCWLQGSRLASILAVAIPGAIALVVNLSCYIGLAVVLSRDLKATQNLSQKSKVLKLKKKCRVFLGLFCLLGLTLGFAWIAAFVGKEWLWYIFFVANMTQAIVIFFVFVVSQKTRALYKEKFRAKHWQLPSSNQSESTNTSTVNKTDTMAMAKI